MDSENVGAVQRKHAQATAIFQIAQKYAPSLVRNVNSTVVLLGLVISILNKVVTWHKQYLCGPNIYYDRIRENCSISCHNPPFLFSLRFFSSFTFPHFASPCFTRSPNLTTIMHVPKIHTTKQQSWAKIGKFLYKGFCFYFWAS